MRSYVILNLICSIYFTWRGFYNLDRVQWLGILQICVAIFYAGFAQYILIQEQKFEDENNHSQDE